jgi:hypothetical protein
MKQAVLLVGVFGLLLTAGCVGTKVTVHDPFDEKTEKQMIAFSVATEDEVPQKALDIFTDRLGQRLNELKSYAVTGNEDIKMDIVFTNYYMRHGAVRFLIGVLAGADSIVTKVRLADAKTGVVLSEYTVESTNPTATSTSARLIRQHADKVARYAVQQRL